jgi:hypothetical protein
MRHSWRWLFFVLVVPGVALIHAGCTTTASSASTTAGRDGWVRTKNEPGKALTVERGSDTVVIREGDTSTEYCIVAKPAFLHSPSGIVMPLFPGSALLRSTSYGYKEHRFYTIPAGKTFANVYNWYLSWFEFADRP